MNKKSVLNIILDLIFLVIFNAIFFVAGGTEHPSSVWISYVFIHVAYLMVVLTPFLIRKSSSAAVFGFSLYTISTTYFFIELVVGTIFILIASESAKVAVLVQLILAGIYAAILIADMLTNESIADKVERQEIESAFIKRSSSRIKILEGKSTDKAANKEIEKAYYLLHSSPSRSTASVKLLEDQINTKISELETAVKANHSPAIIAAAGQIIELTEERNRRLRLSN